MIEQLVRILVDAGAEPLAAVRAAEVLDRGGSVREAAAALDIVFEPLEFDPELMLLEALLVERATAVLA